MNSEDRPRSVKKKTVTFCEEVIVKDFNKNQTIGPTSRDYFYMGGQSNDNNYPWREDRQSYELVTNTGYSMDY
jgi:hypothetical protein